MLMGEVMEGWHNNYFELSKLVSQPNPPTVTTHPGSGEHSTLCALR